MTHCNKRYIVTATNRFFGNVSLLPASLLNTNPPPLVVPAKQCTDVETTAEGTYYSDDCAEHCVGATQHPRRNLMCWSCERLVHEDDFNHRVTDRAATLAGGGFHPNTRSDNLPYDALLERTRGLASKCEAERLMRMRAMSKLAASRVRAQRAEGRLEELCDAGNLSAVVRDLHACHDSGAFDDNQAALNFIKDLAQHARNRNSGGSGGTGTRYSESTKRIFGLIDKLGGPKTHFALQTNVGGTSLSAAKRHWRKSRTDFEPGIHAAAFIAIANVLKPYIAKLKSEGGLQDENAYSQRYQLTRRASSRKGRTEKQRTSTSAFAAATTTLITSAVPWQ